MEMEKMEFDEVADIFDRYKIWMGAREMLWYKKAWLALEKGGLTLCKNSIDRNKVFIRVFTLIMIYLEYCELAFDEYCPYDFDWQGDSELSAFRVGQIFSQAFKDEDLSHYDDDFDALYDAFMKLVENERANVFASLLKNIGKGSVSTVFVSLYVSRFDMLESEEEDEEEWFDDEEDDLTLTSDGTHENEEKRVDDAEDDSSGLVADELTDDEKYEKYEKDIKEYYGEIVNDPSPEKLEAFEWLSQGTYRIR